MMRMTAATVFMFLVVSAPLYSGGSGVGYKEFTLGQTRQEVKKSILGKYEKVTFTGNQDMAIETGEMVNTKLYFDHQDRLFLIQVEIKWGEIAKVKQRLIDTHGQPNDFTGEEFNRSRGFYLMARWTIEKRYKISAWETEDCRGSKLNPCVVIVEYLDSALSEGKMRFEQKNKADAQKKKEGKTYDGF